MEELRRKNCARCAPLIACLALMLPWLLQAATFDPTFSGPEQTAATAAKSGSPALAAAALPPAAVASSPLTGSAYSSKEQPDGKIVVAGHEERTLLVARFNADGTPDTSFGDNGRFLLTGVVIWYEGGLGLDLQADGSIVLAAMTYFSGPGNIVLVRLTSGGVLDKSFGGSGLQGKTVSNRAFLKRLFVLPDGRIVTGGNYPGGIWAARYQANGAADLSFAGTGVSRIAQPTQNNHAGQIGQLLPLPDGKMLMLSLAIITSGVREAWQVDRLTAAGAIDPTFNRIRLAYGGSNSWIGSMARLNDGRLAVSIPTFDSAYSSGAFIALYSADGVPQGTIGSGAAGGGNADQLVVRSDASLCGKLATSILQMLPAIKVLSTRPSSYYGLTLDSLTDGGLLDSGQTNYPQISRPFVQRFTAAGVSSVSYIDYSPATSLLVPEIVVEAPYIVFDGDTLALGSSAVNSAGPPRTFTIRNTGTGSLTNLAVSIDGVNASDFSATVLTTQTLAAGASQTFMVSFIPRGAGTRTATLHISSNDADEGGFRLLLSTTGIVQEPEIAVESPTSLVDGSSLTLGTGVIKASPLSRLFTIRNTGSSSLTRLALSIDGPHADDFTTTALAATAIAVGGSQTFTLSFAPKAAGPRSATLHIASNDADENPFDIMLSGQGSGVDVSFANGARLSRPPAVINLGTVNSGSQTVRNFTITNSGPLALTGLHVVPGGQDASQLTVLPAFPASLAPGETFTFTVQFSALTLGNRVATLQLLSDSADEPALDMTFSATVMSARLVVKDVGGNALPAPGRNAFVSWGASASLMNITPFGLTGVMAIAQGDRYVLALKENGTVAAWGTATEGQTSVPRGLLGVKAIAAGVYHALALKEDGSIIGWGYNEIDKRATAPAGLKGVTAIAAGGAHSVALRQDGTVVCWGNDSSGQCHVPARLTGVTAIAAGAAHTVAVKQDGSVVAWGANDYGQTRVPARLTDVIAVAASYYHTVALKRDGSVVAWGMTTYGQTSVPTWLTGVTAITAGYYHTAVLRQDGTVVTWGSLSGYQTRVPAGLRGALAISTFGGGSSAIAEPAADFGVRPLKDIRLHAVDISSTGMLPLTGLRAVIEGADADQFRLMTALPDTLAVNATLPFTFCYVPTRVGPVNATLKILSNDSSGPFVLPLTGTGNFLLAATPQSSAASHFTYAPVRLDRSTGLLLQKLTFFNMTGTSLNGLRLILSKVAAGVTVYSSSPGTLPGTLEVHYTNPLAAGQTISFDLVYADPQRRTANSIVPTIMAEALETQEPAPGPVDGTLVPLLSARATVQGPMFEWNAKTGSTYAMEYSDDGGNTWFSAVHRLHAGSTRLFWVDRGQPETQTKPVGAPNKPGGRYYRVKRL